MEINFLRTTITDLANREAVKMMKVLKLRGKCRIPVLVNIEGNMRLLFEHVKQLEVAFKMESLIGECG